MERFIELQNWLKESLNEELTPSQSNIVYVNCSLNPDGFDVVNFLKENNITPSIEVARLSSLGRTVENYWYSLGEEEKKEYCANPAKLSEDVALYEHKLVENESLGGLER